MNRIKFVCRGPQRAGLLLHKSLAPCVRIPPTGLRVLLSPHCPHALTRESRVAQDAIASCLRAKDWTGYLSCNFSRGHMMT